MFDSTSGFIKVVWDRTWIGLYMVLLVGGLVGLSPHSASAQQALPKISFPIQVSTPAGDGQRLTLGLNPSATEGIDEALGETEQPPLPPSTIFDARLVDDGIPVSGLGLGTVTDIRPGPEGFSGTKAHRIQVQPGPEEDSISFSWRLPDGVQGTIEDALTVAYGPVEMEGRGSLTVGAQAPDAIVTLEYSGSQKAVNVQAGTVGESGRLEFPGTGVVLELLGVVDPGTMLIRRFGNAPESPEGIAEENVSGYRYVVEERKGLSFDRVEVEFVAVTLPGVEDPRAVRAYRREEPDTGVFAALETTVRDNGTRGDFSDDTLSVVAEGFGEFALGSDANPLPVELSGFEGRAIGGDVRLTWQTASEDESAGFEVYRRPLEISRQESAGEWEKIGFVESEAEGGTTDEPQRYQFEDSGLPFAANRLAYRLRQVDLDGTTELTNPVEVKRTAEELQLKRPYPNPTGRQSIIEYALPEETEITIAVYDVLGRRVRVLAEGPEQAGRHEARLEASQMPSGTYFVRMRASGFQQTRRITVVR